MSLKKIEKTHAKKDRSQFKVLIQFNQYFMLGVYLSISRTL